VHSLEPGRIIVTGGASGLGAAVIHVVGKAGWRPVCLDIAEPQMDIEHYVIDLADTRAAGDATRRVAEEGELRAVVTCAGIDKCGRLEDVDADDWERVIRVNLLGTAAIVRASLKYLEANRGSVVTVASTLGLKGVGDATAYCASKFGVVGFTRALSAETAGRVGVTLLIPGGMDTAFFEHRDERYKPPPDALLNRPEDVAATVLCALQQPFGCEIREMIVCPATETSYP
jgi:NAD(P)-dependent dehydrogenase (short-subunit alcohol dehydrogenase family)